MGLIRLPENTVYIRCCECGSKYVAEMMKPLGRHHICCRCLNLARERRQRDLVLTKGNR